MFDSYEIKSGDSLESISGKYNVSTDYLKDINNLYYTDDFKVGRELIVPKIEDIYFNKYKVVKGDTLYQIAKMYNINPTLLSSLNGIKEDEYIYPNQEIMIPKTGYSYYITAEGDTLEIVKDAFNVSFDKLLKENKTIYLLPEQLIVLKK